MTQEITVTIASKTKPTTQNKAFKDTNNNWYSCTEQVHGFLKKDMQVSFVCGQDQQGKSFVGGDGRVNVVGQAPSQGGGNRGSYGNNGNKGGGKGGYKDNSVGMAVGMCMNNAVALYAGGKIQENQIPTAMANMYRLTEYAKKVGAENGNIDAVVHAGSFLLTKEIAAPQPQQQTAPPQQQAPMQQPQEQVPPQAPDGSGYGNFDDDIPF